MVAGKFGRSSLRNLTNRFMFCAAAAKKNCSRTNFNRRRRKRRSPIWFFSSVNSASTFILCLCACANSGVLASSRARCLPGSCWWMTRQGKTALVHCALSEHVFDRQPGIMTRRMLVAVGSATVCDDQRKIGRGAGIRFERKFRIVRSRAS